MSEAHEKFPGSPRLAADGGRRALALSPGEVFLAYFAMGGTEDQESIYRFLSGDGGLSDDQFDVLAAALNDEFLDRGGNHPVPYSAEFPASVKFGAEPGDELRRR